MKNLTKYKSLLNGEVDGLLLTSRYSRHYGAEYDIAEGVAIVTKAGCRYFTDSRYIECAEKNLKGFEVQMVDRSRSYSQCINDAVADFGVTVLVVTNRRGCSVTLFRASRLSSVTDSHRSSTCLCRILWFCCRVVLPERTISNRYWK